MHALGGSEDGNAEFSMRTNIGEVDSQRDSERNLGGVSGTIIRLSRHRASPTVITREPVLQLATAADSVVLFGYSRASSSPRSRGAPNTESRTVGLNREPFK
jgi:hypothetical protein